MSDNTLRPIWTPEDAHQTARDAAKHVGIPADPDDTQPDMLAGLDVRPALAPWPDGFAFVRPAGMRPRRTRRLAKAAIAVAAGVLVLAVGALWASSQAKAAPPNCESRFWLIPFQSSQRTICDGPIQPDGSWTRLREFWTPAHNVPLRTTCSGGRYSSSCTTTGGYFVPTRSQGIESYIVTPETVLADEPGHLA